MSDNRTTDWVADVMLGVGFYFLMVHAWHGYFVALAGG